MRKIVFTEGAPRPIGPYSQAVCVDGWLFISGQIPLDPKTNSIAEGDFKERVRRVLENIRAIVEAAGGSLENVVKVTVYLKDISRFSEFNEVYERFFSNSPPARSVVGVAELPRNAELEVDATAWIERC
ncbi:MAG: RidA family protein [Ignisphaera sp.]|nr:RidA family protein [Ignisphaera sp.]MDW8086243.1 RidA family protein [Ignisphaera sp.]